MFVQLSKSIETLIALTVDGSQSSIDQIFKFLYLFIKIIGRKLGIRELINGQVLQFAIHKYFYVHIEIHLLIIGD